MGEGSESMGTKIESKRTVFSNQKVGNWRRIRNNREVRI